MSATDILINQIITQALANHPGPKLPGQTLLIIVKFVSIVSALAALFLSMVGFYYWLETYYTQQQTLFYMAVACACISLCSLLIFAMIISIRKKALKMAGQDFIKTVSEFYAKTADAIGDPVKDYHGVALAAAALAGLLVGKRI